jgi:hypothetical protein
MIRTRQIDVHLRFFTGGWIGKPKLPTPRRGAVLLGVFAILLQAVLFAWHHHPLPLSSRDAPAVLAAGPSAGHPTPVLTDDDCQICFALAHHSAASPADFTAVSPARHLLLRLAAIEAALAPAASYLLFRSRAPPRA